MSLQYLIDEVGITQILGSIPVHTRPILVKISKFKQQPVQSDTRVQMLQVAVLVLHNLDQNVLVSTVFSSIGNWLQKAKLCFYYSY